MAKEVILLLFSHCNLCMRLHDCNIEITSFLANIQLNNCRKRFFFNVFWGFLQAIFGPQVSMLIQTTIDVIKIPPKFARVR